MGAGHNGLVAAAYLAKAGKSVLMLEAADEIGGATASVRAFKEYDALLSRYSYLIALLPDQIIKDLGLKFETISREVSSFTPYKKNEKDFSRKRWRYLFVSLLSCVPFRCVALG